MFCEVKVNMFTSYLGFSSTMRRCSGILVASFLKTANVFDEFGVTEEVSATLVISIYVTQVEVLALCMGFLYICVCFIQGDMCVYIHL